MSMGYMLFDRSGFIADIATSKGLRQMQEAAHGKPKTLEFLRTGETADRDAVMAEIGEDARFNELREMLRMGEPPFTISDGTVLENDEEGDGNN